MGILMRAVGLAAVWLALNACTVVETAGTRQYLDSITAATVTVSSQPWVFARERWDAAANLRDYLTLYPIEINRSGERRTYLVAHVWSTVGAGYELPARASLEISADDRLFSIQPLTGDARSIGIGEPIVSAKGRSERIWYYPIAPEALAYFTTARAVSTALSGDAFNVKYQIWRRPDSNE